MLQPVKIENDAVKMEVWPQIGGKVASIIDKHDNFELLFNFPAELPTVAKYDSAYNNSWYAGWDECFPAVSPSKYHGHPYEGIGVPDHGELWGLPTTAVPTKDGITCVWHGLRFGYRLTRKLSLDDAAIVSEYTLVNLAPFEFRFCWAQHALMSMTVPVELDLAHPRLFRLSHDENTQDIYHPLEWPHVTAEHDLSKPAGLPVKKCWKILSAEPIESEIVIRYPSRGRTVSVGYSTDDELPAYWGIWINTGGWEGHKHFALEPLTGRFDHIDRSIRDGSAGRLEPLGRLNWSVRWSLA